MTLKLDPRDYIPEMNEKIEDADGNLLGRVISVRWGKRVVTVRVR